jgi:hypothetical protein
MSIATATPGRGALGGAAVLGVVVVVAVMGRCIGSWEEGVLRSHTSLLINS